MFFFSEQRSFSVLKRIKSSYIRFKITEERLSSSTNIIKIESDLINKFNYDDVINAFANQKARREGLCIKNILLNLYNIF